MAYGVNDLVLTADLPFTKTLTFTNDGIPGDWSLYDVRVQVRHPYYDDLLIELTVFLAVDADPTKLVLSLPGSLTGKLPAEGRYDILAVSKADPEVALRLPRPPGRFLVLSGVTRRD